MGCHLVNSLLWFAASVGCLSAAPGDDVLDAFYPFVFMHCWAQEAARRDQCCATPERPGCFGGVFTRELCCGEPKLPYAVDVPLLNESAEALDEKCDEEWPTDAPEAELAEVVCPDHPPLIKASPAEGSLISLRSEMVGLEDVSLFAWDAEGYNENLFAYKLGGNFRYMQLPQRMHTAYATTSDFTFGQILTVVRPHMGNGRFSKLSRAAWRGKFQRLPEQKEPGDRPSLYLLVLDSVSRCTFRRHMPLTHDFILQMQADRTSDSNKTKSTESRSSSADAREEKLKETSKQQSTHRAFKFGRYHTLAQGATVAQMFPLLWGGLKSCRFKLTGVPYWSAHNMSQVLDECAAVPGGLLEDLRRSGYRTAVSFTWPRHDLSRLLRLATWDHVFPQVGEYVSAPFPRDAFCIGNRTHQQIIMDWAREVFEVYRGLPAFVYVHLEGSHMRRHGIRANDRATRDHLKKVLESNPNLVVALMGDHGYAHKPCDQKSPLLNIIVPEKLLDAYPDVAESLMSNQEKVVSPFDMFMTLRHLIHLRDWSSMPESFRNPYDALRDQGATMVVPSFFKSHEAVHTVALDTAFKPHSLLEAMLPTRGCRAAGILDLHCTVRLSQATARMFCLPHEKLSTTSQREFSRSSIQPHIRHLQICGSMMEGLKDALEVALRRQTGPYTGTRCQPLSVARIEFIERTGSEWRVRSATDQGSPPAILGCERLV
eukprot:TRINITY_DN61066_c0_g1_i4.p1 TRINITY_DN61066_c0_g1~~TRINITY_DN61066_c0_g1_i4.p1  ORF type:complete len:712 (+),score=51.08 TRINITY_DN61066_c0_g1_i4:64-2199(+)